MKSNIFIHIIGNAPDELNRSNKMGRYSQSIHGVIIQKLADLISLPAPIKDDDDNLVYEISKVEVYAFGKQSDYEIYQYTNNRCYFQLDLDHYYELDITKAPKFKYFDDFDELLKEIDELISPNPQSDVIFFLDDHGTEGFFKPIHYLSLYQLMMKYPKYNFLVLNDSCFTGRFIDVVKAYDRIYDLKVLKKIPNIDNVVYPMSKLTKKVFKEAQREKQAIDNLTMVNTTTNIIKFFTNINIPNREILRSIFQLGVDHKDDIGTQKNQKLSSIKLPDGLTVETLNKLGFETVQDILNFRYVICSAISKENGPLNIAYNYSKSKKVFTFENYDFYKGISYNNETHTYDIIELSDAVEVIMDFTQVPHPSIEIITATNENRMALMHERIRVNDLMKVFPGSIGMSSFIKEVFMKLDGQPIRYDNIRKEISDKGDGNIIEFPGRVEQKIGEHKMKQWIGLLSQHLKRGKYQFTFLPKNDLVKQVIILRALSHATSKKLKKVAKQIAPDFSPKSVTNNHDDMGCIIALTAVAKNAMDEGKEIRDIRKLLEQNNIINNHCPLNPECATKIVMMSLRLSKDPIMISALIYNCIQEAVQQIIIERSESKEIDSDMMKAAIALFPEYAVTFAAIIISIHTKEGSVDDVFNVDFYSENASFYTTSKKAILKMDNEEEIKLYAEKCLLAAAVYCLDYVKDIWQSQVAADMVDLIFKYSVENYSAFAIFTAIANRSGYNEMKSTETVLFKAIRQAIDSLKLQSQIPPNFQLAVLSGMKSISTIEAFAVALYDIESKKKILDENEISIILRNRILQVVSTDYQDKYNDTYASELADEILKNAALFSKDNIESLRSNLTKEAMRAAQKVEERLAKCRRNFLLNTGNRIPMSRFGKFQAAPSELKQILGVGYKTMNYSSILSKIQDFESMLVLIDPKERPLKLHDHGLETEMSSFNIGMAYQKAAHELYSAASLIKVSKSSKTFEINKDALEATIGVMLARTFNIVEMAPVIDILSSIRQNFDLSENPSITADEIIALAASGVKHYLGRRDIARVRWRIRQESDESEEIEDDEYYSSDDFEEDEIPTIRSRQSRMLSSDSSAASSAPSPKKITKMKPIDTTFTILREKYNAGRSSWYNDAWIAFVYCFNRQMKGLGIEFDPKTQYEGCKADLRDEFNEVLHFYPITQIRNIKELFSNFCCFAGKYPDYISEIRKAFVKAFDEADRAISPWYLRRPTMQRRK